MPSFLKNERNSAIRDRDALIAASDIPAIKAVLASFRSADTHITEAMIEAAWGEYDGLRHVRDIRRGGRRRELEAA